MTINDGMALIKVLVTWWSVSWLLRATLIGIVGMIVYRLYKKRHLK
ncbi:hypothetical protein [Lactiplantibacillus paraplantarum]|nr:hypothetical protein [Lactiplantibacillus paraplantarum]